MERILLENALLLDPEAAAPQPGWLLVEAGRIAARGAAAGVAQGAAPGAAGPHGIDARRVDLGGRALAPGFIDLHFHGSLILCEGDALDDALARTASSMVRHGTTGFLATSVTVAPARLRDFAARTGRFMTQPPPDAARCIGIHLEGPWIEPACAGAQPVDHARDFDPEEARALLDDAQGGLAMVTLAPERPGGLDAVARLRHAGLAVALGHSAADDATIDAAIGEGMTHVTHLFNAMAPLHHRTLGTAGCALTDPRLSVDLICDGVHVHPRLVRLVAREKARQLCLITDRIERPARAGPPPSAVAAEILDPAALRADGDVWRLPDGRLAGSALTLDRAARRLRDFAGLPLLEAVAAATLGPARVLGREAECGTLRVGARADLAVLGADGEVLETWLAGRRVFAADPGCAAPSGTP